MVEAVLRAVGPYSLRLTARTATWNARLTEERWASARQLSDGRVVVRASCDERRRAGAFHARARRRHDRLPSRVRARSAPRPVGAAPAGPSIAAEGDGDARGGPGGVRSADPGVASARDRALHSPRLRRRSADARGATATRTRASDRLRPDGESSRDPHPARPDGRSRGAADDAHIPCSVSGASEGSAPGRSESSLCTGSVATTRGSWTTSPS